MKTIIGKFEPETSTVPVNFQHQGIRHKRSVNACLDDHGGYDRAATAARVVDVAAGVAHKIEIGVIGPEPATGPAAE